MSNRKKNVGENATSKTINVVMLCDVILHGSAGTAKITETWVKRGALHHYQPELQG